MQANITGPQGQNPPEFVNRSKDAVFSLHIWRMVLETNYIALMSILDRYEKYGYKEEYPDPIFVHLLFEAQYTVIVNYLSSVAGIKQCSYALKEILSDDVFNDRYK
jgi:hypothetical protein